jgi:hypothetical protein
MTNDTRPPDKSGGGVTIGTIIDGVHNSIIAGRDVIINAIVGSTAEQRAQRNRRAMLKLVGDFWVKGVLEQSLHGAVMIELGLEEWADAVEHPWDMVVQMPDRLNRALQPGIKIVDVFDEMNHALLILGEPGSGKTTVLLELARDMIAHAEQDPTQPIPVVFNLSSWAEKRQPIADWLVEELSAKYNIPRKIARPWIENDELVLLLDGLDEVAQGRQEDCVRAINDFRQEHMMPLVVCSRVADYEALTIQLRLQGAVLLQSLTSQQIDEYLDQAGVELSVVREVLRNDTTVQELAQSPLMLSVMTLAYRGMSIEGLGTQGTPRARRKHLFDTYVQRMFSRRGTGKLYSPEQTVRWLAWLAQRMLEHTQTVFLVERMQPYWLQTGIRRWLYIVIPGFISALVFGLLGRLLIGPIGALIIASIYGLAGLLNNVPMKIEPVEVLKWKGVTKERVSELTFRLIGLLTLLLTCTLGYGLMYGWALAPFFGFGAGLAAAFAMLVFGLRSEEIETRIVPNQGIRQSAKNAAVVTLIIGLSASLCFASVGWSVFAVAFGSHPEVSMFVKLMIAGVAGALNWGLYNGGGLPCIQHFTLRFILSCNSHIPWDYVRFLNSAADRIFLRKVGGGYIFIHRLLQEYFASLYQGE